MRVLISLILLVGLLLVTGQVLAQDGGVLVPNLPTDGVEEMALRLFTLIVDATYLPFAAGFVALLTAITKRFSPTDANVIALLWTVIVWAGYVAAQRAGYALQFETMTEAMTTLGSVVLGVTITPVVAGRLYSFARENNVAVVGYSRPTAEIKN